MASPTPAGDTVVLARPMDRFFNHGQGGHVVTDDHLAHDDTRVFEKLDGTLCIVYFDPYAPDSWNEYLRGEWCVATRSVPDADLPIDGFGDHTFRSLFEASLPESWPEFCARLDRRYTYCFELTSPRAGSGVVDHGAVGRVTLLAVRSTMSGAEVCPRDVEASSGLVVVPHHVVTSVADMVAFVEGRPATLAEGVVVRLPDRCEDGSYRRIKVKSSTYVAAHGLSSGAGASPRNLLRTILAGQWDDVRVIVRPHLRDAGDDLATRLATWCAGMDAMFDVLEHKGLAQDRKAFALAVTAAGAPMPLMMARWTRAAHDAASWLQSRKDTKHADGWHDGFLDTLSGWLAAS